MQHEASTFQNFRKRKPRLQFTSTTTTNATLTRALQNVNYKVNIGKDIYNPECQSYPYFQGFCYNCDYPQHSQNYCPLRQCSICKLYGHGEKVCYYAKANNEQQHHHTKPYRYKKPHYNNNNNYQQQPLRCEKSTNWRASGSDDYLSIQSEQIEHLEQPEHMEQIVHNE